MDEIVLRAMAKWPSVPARCGLVSAELVQAPVFGKQRMTTGGTEF
jgi:hypothetical protein